jgi:hypothetical protein
MATYDPSKRYTWSPEDKFEFSGQEFGLILNTFRAILNTEQAAHILLAKQCSDAIEVVMKRSVESGMIKEQPSPEVPPGKSIMDEAGKYPFPKKSESDEVR